MAGAHRSADRTHRRNRKNGSHRVAPKPSRQPYNWLGVSAVTLGLGAAMASGTGIASAKGGDGSSSSNSSSNAAPSDSSSSASGTTSSSSGNARKPAKKPRPATAVTTDSSGSPSSATSDSSTGSTASSGSNGSGSGAASTTGGKNTKAGKGTKKTAGTSTAADQPTATGQQSKTKPRPTAATATTATSSSTATAAPPAAATAAAATATSATKAVALAAAAPVAATDSTTTTTTTTTTTAHATSTNPILAAIQNALISFLTTTSTITQLAANGLTGPTAPSSVLNPVGAFLYGIFRGMEDFAGLVPHAGTPTTTSDTTTGTVSGTLGFTEPAGAQMTYTVATNPLFGSVTVNTDGTYTYKSNILGSALSALGLNPTDKFTVTASTGVASTNVTVTVPVVAANDTPSIPTSTNQVANTVNGVVTGTLASTAPDGQAVSYSVLTNPLQGSVSLSTNNGVTTYTYTPTDLARTAADLTALTGLNVDAFTVTATSAGGQTSLPGIITVPIEPASGATPSTPTATNVSANAVTGVVTGTITSTSPDGGAVNYSVLVGALGGSVTLDSATGAFTYTPTTLARMAANPILGISVINTDAFTVTATNAGGYTSAAIITVPIEPANSDTPSTPAATNVSTNTVTGVVTGTLSSTSPDGGAVTYSVLTGTLGGTVTVNSATGAFTYTPTAIARIAANPILGVSVINTDAFTVTATNAAGYGSTAIITVPISPADSAAPSTPTATNVNANAVSGVVTGTISSTSPDGGAVSYSVLTGTVLGTLALNDTTGAFTYTPSAIARTAANPILGISVVNTDAFTVTATNASGFTSTAIITVPIEPATGATPSTPTASNLNTNATTGVVTGTISATSPDGGAVTYSVLTGTLGGSVTVNGTTGAFTYTPTALARVAANPILGVSVVNTDAFTVTATNTAGYTSTAIITVPISPANSATPSTPTASNLNTNTTTGVVTGTISATSPDGGTVTYSVLTGTLAGSITVNSTTGAFTYTPTTAARIAANPILGVSVVNTDAFTVTATSSAGFSSTAIITVPIEPANSSTPSTPTATNVSANAVTGVVTGTISSTSPDGGTVTYSVLTGTLGGTVTVNSTTGAFTYTPTALARTAANPILGVSVVNTDAFTVTATSSAGFTSAAIITVPIEPATGATPSTPTATNITTNSSTGVVTGTLVSTSPDGGSVSYTVIGLPTQGTIKVVGNTFTYTPSTLAQLEASLGLTTDTFAVTATNSAGYTSGFGTVTVTVSSIASVLDIPSNPASTGQSANTISGVVTGTVAANDPAGAPLTYSVLTGPLLGTLTLNSTTGAYTYTPTNAARTAANPILGVSVVNTDAFSIAVSNGTFSSVLPAVITVPIAPAVNDTPSAPTASQSQNIYSGVVTGTLSSTSPDGGAITYTVTPNVLGNNTTTNSSITLTTVNGVTSYTYTPTKSARYNAESILNGGLGITSDSFTINATNSAGFSNSSTITVPISPASNDTPTAPTATKNQNIYSGVVTGTLSSTSPDGSAITYTISPNTFGNNTTTNSGLTLSTVNGVTTYTYTPTKSARYNAETILNGGLGITSDSFTINATNSAGFSSSSTITVPISPASNDTPTAPTATKNQNTATGVVTGTLSSTSPDGSAITYTISPNTFGNNTTTNSGLTLTTVNGVTTYTYTPTPSARTNANSILNGGLSITSDSFTINATNSAGFSNSSTITVPISPATNDTPSGSVVTHTSSNHKTTGTITGSSPDGTAVTYSAAIAFGSLGSVTINPTTGAYTISSAQVLVYVGGTVTFTVTNTSGFSYDFSYSFPA